MMTKKLKKKKKQSEAAAQAALEAEAEAAAQAAAAAEAEAAAQAAAARNGPANEEAARNAQDQENGLDYEPPDNEEEMSSEGDEDDAVGPRNLYNDMDVEVQQAKNAPDSNLTDLSSRELQALLFKEEVARNLVRLREGLEELPFSAAALLHIRTQEAAIPPTRDIAVSARVPSASALSGGASTPGAQADNSSVPAETVSPASEPVSSVSGGSPSATSSPDPVPSSVSGGLPSATPSPDTLPQQASSTVAVGNATSSSVVNRSYLQAASQVSLSSSDLRGVPILDGSEDQDVSETLSHFHSMCKLRTDVISNDPNLADEVALRHITMIGKGEVLTFIQQLLAGEIDCSRAGESQEPSRAGYFVPPKTWKAMRNALLNFLLPANSIEEGALAIARIEQGPNESVRSYALRYRTILTRFKASVDRELGKRTVWDYSTVSNWRRGLKPAIHILQRGNVVSSLKEAEELASRLETSGLTGSHVSAIAAPQSRSPHPAPRSSSQPARKYKQTVQMRPVATQQQPSTRKPKKGKKDRPSKNDKGFRSDGSFDPCTHPTCRSHQSHPLENCWAKENEEREATGKPARRHKKRFRWIKEPLSDSE